MHLNKGLFSAKAAKVERGHLTDFDENRCIGCVW